jgi:hypothetical protein
VQEYFDRIEGNEEQIRLEERILAEVSPRLYTYTWGRRMES